MPYFNCSLLLEPGSVVRPGNWGRIVRLSGTGHPEANRETLLEEVRAAEFPDRPSRFDCAYVIDDLAEAQYYAQQKSRLNVIYEVALIDPTAKSHVADWKGTGPYDHTPEWARRYWRGDIMDHPETEFALRERLTLSRLQIRRQI